MNLCTLYFAGSHNSVLQIRVLLMLRVRLFQPAVYQKILQMASVGPSTRTFLYAKPVGWYHIRGDSLDMVTSIWIDADPEMMNLRGRPAVANTI